MSWNAPQSVSEAADSIASGRSFGYGRQGISGHAVGVLSRISMDTLDRDHPLTDHVVTGAEHYREHYMTTDDRASSRRPHPSVVVYYVRYGNRVILALQADGTVLDELQMHGPEMRETTRTQYRRAIYSLARKRRERAEHDADYRPL